MLHQGHHVKRLRREYGYTLQEFADRLGFSVSYISQIENGSRPITTAFAQALEDWDSGVHLKTYINEDERLAREIHDAMTDALFSEPPPEIAELIQASAASPTLAKRFISLYHSYRENREIWQQMPKSVEKTTLFSEQNGALYPHEEVRDYVWVRNNYIDELDTIAEELTNEHQLRIGNMEQDLINLLWQEYKIRVQLVSDEHFRDTLRSFDPQTNTLRLSTQQPPERRAFHLACQFGQMHVRDTIDTLISKAELASNEARFILRNFLISYFAAALLMPYQLFKKEAKRLRHDLEALEIRFGVTFESACQRLSTLQRPNQEGIPFYFVRVDMAGNISKRHSASNFQFARFGGACPLWNVHGAFITPGQITTQVARLPNDTLWFCIARTVTKAGGGYLANNRRFSIGLGCELQYADQIIYSTGRDLKNFAAIQAIGPGCRTCTHQHCAQRAFAPVNQQLKLDPLTHTFEPFPFE